MHILKPQIDIGIVTQQAEQARFFYGKILGLKQGKSISLDDGVIQDRFFIGRNVIKINHVPNVSEKYKGGMDNAIGIRLLTLIVDDLDAIISRMKDQHLRTPDAFDFNGVSIAFCKDSDGNLLEFVDARNSINFEHSNAQHDDRIQIGLCVENSEASKHFYGNILEFTEQPEMDMGNGKTRFAFKGGDTLIKFWQGDKDISKFTGRHFDKIGLRYFTYQIDNIDNCYSYVKSQGIKIMQEPTDIDGVCKILLIADPDDNCIEFVEYYLPNQ